METYRPWIAIDQALSFSNLRYRCRRIELLDLETPVELLPHSRFAWVAVGEEGYRLGLTGDSAIPSTIKMCEAHVAHQLSSSEFKAAVAYRKSLHI